MAGDARESETSVKVTKEEVHEDIESRIKSAMAARAAHLRAKADTLTFEGVRRMLETDLGLEKFALDGQKSFVKQCLAEYLEGANEDSKKSGDGGERNSLPEEDKREAEPHKELTSKDDGKSRNSEDDMEDSPVMGLLTGSKVDKSSVVETEGSDCKELKESTIKEAMKKRTKYIKANLENLTLGELRRLLEKDLGLDKGALDPYKKFISQQLDKMLEASEADTEIAKKNVKKVSQGKTSKKASSKAGSASDSESEEIEEDDKRKKKTPSKTKLQKSEGPRKRKRPTGETEALEKKRNKHSAVESEDENDSGDSGVSDNGQTTSSSQKSAKKKEVSNPAYGKRVEHLKSVIKSCGMGIPPAIYKRVKQAPENKREACLIKELEGILAKEGLSANPSEKEIKEVKKRKQREKELEGIDMSNIVTSSRRRSATNFVVPPKPKVPIESDSDDAEDTDEGDEDDDDNDDEEEENEEDGSKSQGEDSNDENDEDSE